MVEWSNSLGSPQVQNLVVYQGNGTSTFVALTDVTLQLEVPPNLFRRGDCTGNGTYDIGDAVRILGLLFGLASSAPCQDACDGNDDATIDIADAILILANLFAGAPQPPAPHQTCGQDLTDDALDCVQHGPCS